MILGNKKQKAFHASGLNPEETGLEVNASSLQRDIVTDEAVKIFQYC
jgi:hypothetical protein